MDNRAPLDRRGRRRDDRWMETADRLTAVETALTSLTTDVAVIKSNYVTKDDLAIVKIDLAVMRANCATKKDLEKAINRLTWKMYGFGTALVAVVYFIARNVH